MYLKYLKYILEHKWNIGIECIKNGLFIHAITHDLSKFRPSEFFPYARFFYSTEKTDKIKADFDAAWNHHQKRNKHHWNYWICIDGQDKVLPMPKKYVRQMICDWKGMSRKFGDTAYDYYEKNRHKMKLHEDTEILILEELCR